MLKKSNKFAYGMKAAPLYREQLVDRVSKFRELHLRPIIELHLFGEKDIFNEKSLKICIENCLEFEAEYYVHFPIQDQNGYGVYDPAVHSLSYFESVLDFAKRINAKAIVMHRFYGASLTIDRSEAEYAFNNILKKWAMLANPVHIFVENYGHVWLPESFNKLFVVSSLDHFFPWEINDFYKNLELNSISNVSVVIDIAHAALSCNMFNLLKKYSVLKEDPRFANIISSDILRTDFLKIEDFLFYKKKNNYFHLSDALVLDSKVLDSNLSVLDDIDKYITTEGLPLGTGNINIRSILEIVRDSSILIMEINSLKGHHNNQFQADAIEYIYA